MVKILNPLSLTEALRHRVEALGPKSSGIFSPRRNEGHEESHKVYFPLASCSVETNPFEKMVLSQTL
ncbi:MAG: hypothetical protein WCP55_04465, partial [Lentisphaerota bacterium]